MQSYWGTVQNGQITLIDDIRLPEGGKLIVTVVEPDSLKENLRGITGAELLDSESAGMWEHREYVTDNAQIAEQLRNQAFNAELSPLLKAQIIGINKLISSSFGTGQRLSTVLHALGFSDEQITVAKEHHLERVVNYLLKSINHFALSREDGDRLSRILTRRLSLDGQPASTLEVLAIEFGVTRERIRQLEIKILRKYKSPKGKRQFLSELTRITSILIGEPANPPLPGQALAAASPSASDHKSSFQEHVEQVRQKHPRAYEKWEASEEDQLVLLFEQGKSINELAELISRNPGAVQTRLRRLGLIE
jgi:hypothetical protein